MHYQLQKQKCFVELIWDDTTIILVSRLLLFPYITRKIINIIDNQPLMTKNQWVSIDNGKYSTVENVRNNNDARELKLNEEFHVNSSSVCFCCQHFVSDVNKSDALVMPIWLIDWTVMQDWTWLLIAIHLTVDVCTLFYCLLCMFWCLL